MPPKRVNLMKLSTIAFLITVLFTPTSGLAQQSTPQSNDIPIELVQENDFVLKMMDVINKSGTKIQGIVELDSFGIEEKVFIFKNSNGKLKTIPDKEIKKIVFSRLRQGILTGKPSSLRVNVWNGKIRNFKLNYSAVKIKDGYLFISQNELLNHFDGSDTLRANSYEWSKKLHGFWKRIKEESPEVFSNDFAFKDGYGIISRKMAAAYCQACLKIEILNLKIDPEKETILIHCKDVFYDKYNE
jgi:hypothetical protein